MTIVQWRQLDVMTVNFVRAKFSRELGLVLDSYQIADWFVTCSILRIIYDVLY